MPITPLTLEDSIPATHLHQAAFYRGWTEKDFQGFLKDPLVFGVKVEELNKFCGFILWREVEDEAEILTLVVDPSFQRMGMGDQLLKALFEQLKEKRISKLFLEVAEDNEKAKSFYMKKGFSLMGKRPNYYERPNHKFVDALNLVRDVVPPR